MLRPTLLLGAALAVLSACAPSYYPPPVQAPSPLPLDPSRVTPPPPPVDVIRPKV